MNSDAAGKLAKRDIAQIMMLSAQLLLGMAVNLVGLPKETNGVSKVVTTALLVIHIGIGIGLLVGSFMTVRLARSVTSHFVRDAWTGMATVTATFVAGVFAVMFDNNWWSYVMAVGFLASFLLYGAMFVYADRLHRAKSNN